MEFIVAPEFRRRRIGVRLQEAAMVLARSLDCYQLASFSYSGNAANHLLKLSLGFAVRPESRGDEAHGLYFIMPLQPNAQPPGPLDDR
jgi:GNAT superfamily N-acetyltransferase